MQFFYDQLAQYAVNAAKAYIRGMNTVVVGEKQVVYYSLGYKAKPITQQGFIKFRRLSQRPGGEHVV